MTAQLHGVLVDSGTLLSKVDDLCARLHGLTELFTEVTGQYKLADVTLSEVHGEPKRQLNLSVGCQVLVVG